MDINFLIEMPPFFWFEVIALLTSIFCWSYLLNYLKWFVPFLAFIVLIEIFGRYIPSVLHKHNAWIFNFSVPIEYLFYSFIYYRATSTASYKKVIQISGIVYFVFCIIVNLLNGISVFQNPLLIAGNSLAISYSCIYFYEILKSDKIINLWKEPVFWITCGIFLFNLGEITYTLFRPVMRGMGWDITLAIFKAINNTLIFWLYGFISIGFLSTRKLWDRKTSK